MVLARRTVIVRVCSTSPVYSRWNSELQIILDVLTVVDAVDYLLKLRKK